MGFCTLTQAQKGKAKRLEIINTIELFIKNQGYSPIVRELCRMVDLKSPSTLQGHLEILKNEDSIEGVILGCTELPLILTKDEFCIPFLDTSKIHVESVIKYYLYGK